ncbi:MAG TPA: competence/damage-inducible protein A [bacterium]|jgi:nicotinamide-nucleotide amidase|nr:competence/damage-inducible protein A [bacterium]
MKAEIISVGTELLLGQIVDTNAAYLAQRLAGAGVDVYFKQTVGDNPARVQEAVRLAMSRADLIVMTGGLGPTEDDLTVAAIAGLLGLELIRHDAIAEAIGHFFESRGRTPPETVFKQALIPAGARPIPNTRGTAPGIHLEHDGTTIVIMPGVPYEMEAMVTDYLLPLLRERMSAQVVIGSRVLRVTGEGESAVEVRIRDLVGGTAPTIAPYAKLGEVHLRLTAKGGPDEVRAQLDRGERLVRERLGRLVYGTDDQTLEQVTGILLADRGLTVSVAESCTGGLIGERFTNVPGSSGYFLGGIVAYSDALKINLLDVPPDTIAEFGAVSAQTAGAMAAGVRGRTGSHVGLAVTGIAGPGGATADKPVGLVFLGLADADGTRTHRLQLGPEPGRRGVRLLAAQAALNWLRLHLIR